MPHTKCQLRVSLLITALLFTLAFSSSCSFLSDNSAKRNRNSYLKECFEAEVAELNKMYENEQEYKSFFANVIKESDYIVIELLDQGSVIEPEDLWDVANRAARKTDKNYPDEDTEVNHDIKYKYGITYWEIIFYRI